MIEVRVEFGDVDSALKKLKKRTQTVFSDFNRHSEFKSKAQRRREKIAVAKRRRKQMQASIPRLNRLGGSA